MKPVLKPLNPGEVYVVVTDLKPWRQYPLPAEVVARATILTMFEPLNESPYVLVFHNFPSMSQHVQRKDVQVFSYSAHALNDSTYGLSPAFSP